MQSRKNTNSCQMQNCVSEESSRLCKLQMTFAKVFPSDLIVPLCFIIKLPFVLMQRLNSTSENTRDWKMSENKNIQNFVATKASGSCTDGCHF